MSSCGQYQTTTWYDNSGIGQIWNSTNYGSTWTENTTANTTTLAWFSVSMSSSGQYQTAVVQNGGIWNSSDYGSTWSQNATANTTSGVKVTVAKGFRFGGSKVAATEAAFA
jgi:hypothetical protein